MKQPKFLRTSLLAAAISALGVMPAHSQLIDFETTPGGAGSTDNDPLSLLDSYTVSSPGGDVFVSFGFDTDMDFTADIDGIFEDRTSSWLDEAPLAAGGNGTQPGQFGYTVGEMAPSPSPIASSDTDFTPTNEGDDFLLRAPRTDTGAQEVDIFDGTTQFLITYTGADVTSASGQLWDADNGEQYFVTAYDALFNEIGMFMTDPTTNDEAVGTTRNGLPTTFSFANLSAPIAYIGIKGFQGGNGRGFAFDNFNATSPAVFTSVPEPTSILGFLGFAGAVSLLKRKRNS